MKLPLVALGFFISISLSLAAYVALTTTSPNLKTMVPGSQEITNSTVDEVAPAAVKEVNDGKELAYTESAEGQSRESVIGHVKLAEEVELVNAKIELQVFFNASETLNMPVLVQREWRLQQGPISATAIDADLDTVTLQDKEGNKLVVKLTELTSLDARLVKIDFANVIDHRQKQVKLESAVKLFEQNFHRRLIEIAKQAS